MATTAAEREDAINALIIDNNTNQVTPSKVRAVLKLINDAINITNPSSVFAIEPLYLDSFTNQFSISKASETQDGYISKEDYLSLKSSSIPKMQFFANGTDATFDLETTNKAKVVFWNGALLDDSDWFQTDNILTLTFIPDNGAIIKPI